MSWFEDQAIDAPTAAPPPQAGQFAPTNQGFLDWATQQYGADPVRGGGFVNAQAGGGLPAMLDAYRAATGNQADYQAGPSGDRVNFGQGTQDALTSGGQVWNAAGGGGGGNTWQSGNVPIMGDWGPGGVSRPDPGGGGWGGPMPTAPGVVPLGTPAPFVSTAGQLGSFQTPTPFTGDRQAAPETLTAQGLATPDAYGHENYRETTAADLEADPGYRWRRQQGLEARENSAAAKGMLRGGNTLKALDEYGQGLAAQEFAAVDARRRATSAANNAGQLGAYQTNAQTGLSYNQNANQNALAFGQQNLANRLAVNEANYGRGASEAQQGFQNQLAGYTANLGAQGQNYNQQLGAYQQNAQTGLAYNQNTNAANLADYAARVNAGLGYGNLALGQQQAANSFALGQGNLGIQRGQLGLQQQGQGYDQNLKTFLTNYQTQVQDPWTRQIQLGQLGQPMRLD